ncbi:MAG TPA: helix-turn-helix domain-containing protein [Pseudonocardiaceae bacterium]|jgi:AcrR family transcriptional regulator|nr:helix-turn-helix domain-containing protein [Pseudonocardiaceae bacterium]
MAETRAYHSPRREQAAAATRSEIMTAARELFALHGYPRVTVAEIARQAHTAVKTVYASAGGKAEILAEILAEAVADSGGWENLDQARATTDLASTMAVVAHGTRLGNENLRDIVDIMYSATGSDENAEQVWAQGSTEYRQVLAGVAQHVADLGVLGIDLARARDVLWFCFGFGAWRALVRESGWSFDEAEAWLCEQAIRMLTGT